jgi:hypothetical protein
VRPTTLLDREKDHDAQGGGHNPAGETRASCKVGTEEENEERADLPGLGEAETGKVDHVGDDVDDGEKDDGPCGGLVEGDVLVKGDDVAQGGNTEEGDKVAADGEEDERGIDVQDQGGGAGNGWIDGQQTKQTAHATHER